MNEEPPALGMCTKTHNASGEGVIGTMWALFAAGARSVMVSQFPVESKSTTALLVGFHRRFTTEDGSKAEHLRAAAIELLHTPRYAHPYYWAGFILVGDAQPVHQHDLSETIGSTQHGCGVAGSGSATAASMTPR